MSMPPQVVEETKMPIYQGVEGWLAVFCLVLIVVLPASTMYQVFDHTLPMCLKTHDPRRLVLWTVYIVFSVGIAGLAFITGIRLWLIRPGALRLAKLWLLAFFCSHVSYFFLWLFLFHGVGTSPMAKVAWDHVLGPFCSFALWSAYLQYSKRVRQTYLATKQE